MLCQRLTYRHSGAHIHQGLFTNALKYSIFGLLGDDVKYSIEWETGLRKVGKAPSEERQILRGRLPPRNSFSGSSGHAGGCRCRSNIENEPAFRCQTGHGGVAIVGINCAGTAHSGGVKRRVGKGLLSH
jgi:hypothetical protein